MDKQAKLELITTVMIIGFGSAIIYHYIVGKYLGFVYPHDAFLFTPDDKFRDFLNLLDYRSFFAWLFKNDGAENAIFPVMGWFIKLFSSIGPPHVSLAVFLGIFITFFAVTSWSQVKLESFTINIRNVFVLTFMSFPVLFVLDRANFEVIVYVLLFGFTYFYAKELYVISALILSLAICMKIFPAVFIILYISDRKYGKAVLTVLLTLGLTIIPLSISASGLGRSLNAILANLDSYNKLYALKDMGLDFGHSAFGLFKVLLYRMHMEGAVSTFLLPYTLAVLCLFLIIAVYVIIVEKQLWKKIMLLMVAMCLFPHVSGDYKLLHIYIPMFLFLNVSHREKLDFWYALLFALLVVPKNYRVLYIDKSHLWVSDVYTGVIVDPLLLFVFIILIIVSGLRIIRKTVVDKCPNEA